MILKLSCAGKMTHKTVQRVRGAGGSSLRVIVQMDNFLYNFLMFTFSPDEGGSQLEACPCLLEFISAVVGNTASDPGVLSFALKLTGLLAATEDGFKMLQVELMTLFTFINLLPTFSDW